MPPVADRAGLTAVHPPLAEARTLFDRLGSTLEVADVVAYEALSATSATLAGFFEYLRTQTDWLEARGIPSADARRYVAATYAGALTSLEAVDAPDFAELAADYATPGGVNEQVARELREHGTFDALARRSTGRSGGWPPEPGIPDLAEDDERGTRAGQCAAVAEQGDLPLPLQLQAVVQRVAEPVCGVHEHDREDPEQHQERQRVAQDRRAGGRGTAG